ncbi:MAG: TRL-like family protein [Thiovulaceae bacterium]|nr:TRL-like family protein [Sulfurimonadaceae bacterium]
MKKNPIFALLAAAALFTGCAVHPTVGVIYQNIEAPVTATGNAEGIKTGNSDQCTSILGLIATGNCSVESAKTNSGITDVSSVDYQITSYFSVYSTGKTVIKGK